MYCLRIYALAILLIEVASITRAQDKVTFDDHVLPLLRQRCGTCHGSDKKSGGLDVTSYSALMQGGGSGNAIEPGDPAASYLFKLVNHNEEPKMPPDSPPIPEAEREIFRKWIEGGVLENMGSKAAAPKKKKFNLTMDSAPTERPSVVPLPSRLSLQPVLRTRSTNVCPSLATSPWAPLVAVAGQKQVLLFHCESQRLLGVFPFAEGKPQVVKFSRNGSLLLAGGGRGGASGKVVVWNVKDGRRVMEIGDESDTVLAADLSADHKFVALGGPQKVVRIYSSETGLLLHELKKHTDWIYALEFSPDGALLASGDRNGGLFVWETLTGRDYLTLAGHTAAVNSVSWRGDSNLLGSASEDTTIRLWEMENGGQVKSWGGHGGGTAAIEFTRDGRLVSNGRDRVPKIWDQNGAQQRAVEASVDLGLSVTYCDETDRLISGDWTGEIRVWKGADGSRLGNLTTNPETLEERVLTAQRLVAERTSQFDPANANAVAITNEFNNLQQQRNVLAQEKLATDQQLVEAQQQFDILTNSLTQTTQSYQQVATSVGKLEQAVPALLEAQRQISQAMATMEDPATKQIADNLQAKAQEQQSLLQNQKAEVAKLAPLTEELKPKVVTATQRRDETKVKAEQLAANLAAMETKVAAAQQKSAELTKLAADLKAQVDQTAQELVRWQSEISFTAALNEHQAALKAKEDILAVTEQEVSGALLKVAADERTKKAHEIVLAERQKISSDMTSARATVDQEHKALLAQIQTRNGEITQQQAVAEQLGKAITALTAAAKDTQSAVDTMPDDKDVSAALVTLTKTMTAKQVQLKTLQELIGSMTVEKSRWEQSAGEKNTLIAKYNVDLATINAQVVETQQILAAAIKVLEESARMRQQSETRRDQAQKDVDAANTVIAALQGV